MIEAVSCGLINTGSSKNLLGRLDKTFVYQDLVNGYFMP